MLNHDEKDHGFQTIRLTQRPPGSETATTKRVVEIRPPTEEKKNYEKDGDFENVGDSNGSRGS